MTTPSVTPTVTTVPVGLTPVPIASAGSGDTVLVYNQDLINVVYVGYQQTNVGPTNAVPVQPLAPVIMSGQKQLWAACPTGKANLTVAIGVSQIQPSPAQIAEQIALKGINVNISGVFSMTPSGDVTGATDLSVFTGLIGITKYLTMGPGTYFFNAPTPTLTVQQTVKGCKAATFVEYLGTGDCFSQTQPTYSGAVIGGGIQDVYVNGSGHAAGVATAFHFGDIESLNYDGTVAAHFNQAGDMGYHIDNNKFQTEHLEGTLRTVDCSNGYVYDVTGATGTSSFARANVLMFIDTSTGTQNGVVMQNGANAYNCERFSISGNCSGTGGSGGIVLTVTGTVPAGHPGAGATARITSGHFSMTCETNSAAVVQTINLGAGCAIVDTDGPIDFTQGAGTFLSSNVLTGGGTFRHRGTIQGDFTLVETDYYNTRIESGFGSGSTIFVTLGGVVEVNPTAAATGCIIAPGQRESQVLWVKNVSAFTITFAASGTSNVAGGVSRVIQPFSHDEFLWDSGFGLWY